MSTILVTLPSWSPTNCPDILRSPPSVLQTSICLGLIMDPDTNIPSLVGCQASLSGVNHLPVWLLCFTEHWGVMVVFMVEVLYSLSLSSLARVATWSPVTLEKTQLESDLVWPSSSETGLIMDFSVAVLMSNMKHPALLVPVRNRFD